MSPVIEEAEHNSTVMLRLSAVTKFDNKFTVIIIYLCADETKQPYVLCQVRAPTYQKFLDYYIDGKFTAVKPLWDECDDRTEQLLIKFCLREVLQPAVECRYKNCNPMQLTKMLNLDDHDINPKISFRQQDHIIESHIVSVLKPRVSIHMCNQQNRKEVYFLTVCSQNSELPPSYTSAKYGYSIWFTKFVLKNLKPKVQDPYLNFLANLGRLVQRFTEYSAERIFKKVVSIESIEVFNNYEVDLIIIAEVDDNMKVISAYQPSSQINLLPTFRDRAQLEIDEIWPLMKESKGLQSIHSLILRERYARLVHVCVRVHVCVCVCVCVCVHCVCVCVCMCVCTCACVCVCMCVCACACV